MKSRIVFLSMLLVFATAQMLAQDTVVLKSVVVRGDKMRASVAPVMQLRKIDSVSLSERSTSTMSELLIRHSPVFIKTYGPGGLSTASFRGTTASHTLVLWNGFQLNASDLGQVDFNTVPVILADDLSLSWGSGTSSNSGGMGGIVNIDNRPNFGDGFLLDVKQSYGSYNTMGSFLTIGNYGKRLSFRVKLYRNASDNDFEYENLATIPHQTMLQKNADFVNYGAIPEVNVLFRHSLLTVASWNQNDSRNLPPIMPNVYNLNTEEWTKDAFSRNFVSYRMFWNSGSLTLKSAAFIETQHYFLETTNPANNDVITHLNSQNNTLALHQIAQMEQKLYKSWKLDAKMQWDKERVNSSNYSDLKHRDVLSAYAAVQGAPFRRADLRLTMRYDVVDKVSMGVFPTASLSYAMPFLEALSATVGYSHNYRSPSLNDLYWYPGGNENLKPENGKTVDMALRYSVKKNHYTLDFSTGAYFSRVHDWIQWVPTSFRFWVPENVAMVFARGLENHVEATGDIGDCKLSLSGNYVFTMTTDESDNAEINGTKGKQLIYIPKHHANIFASAKWKTWDMSYTMELTGRRNTSFAEDAYFSYSLPAYVLHHLGLGKQFGKFHLELRCNNITDKDYQNVIWRAMPGRSWEVIGGFKW